MSKSTFYWCLVCFQMEGTSFQAHCEEPVCVCVGGQLGPKIKAGKDGGEARVRPTNTPAFSEGQLSPQQRIWGLEECFEVSKLTWSLLQMLRQALIYGTWGHCLVLRLLLCLPKIGSLICPSSLLRL